MADDDHAGWVVRVVVTPPAGGAPVETLFAVACTDPGEAIERVRLHAGAGATTPIETVDWLSAEHIANLGLVPGQVVSKQQSCG